MSALVLLVVALAVYRLTRLIVADAWPPTQWARERIERRTGPDSGWSYFANCPWCLSMYVSGVAVLGLDLLTDYRVPVPGLLWLALSAACGWLSNGEP